MIVVDASVVADALTLGAAADTFRRRLSNEELHAPYLSDHEFISVQRQATVKGLLSSDQALLALDLFDALPVERWPLSGALRVRAFQLRDHLHAYDASDVALAEPLDCPLVTRDARLSRAGGHKAQVELL